MDASELAVIPTHATNNAVEAKRLPIPSAELTYTALILLCNFLAPSGLSSFWSLRELVWNVRRSDHNQTQSIEEWKQCCATLCPCTVDSAYVLWLIFA